MSWQLLASILSIVVIDLVLSGDNALVIGMAAHRLPPRQRRWAIILGGAGAIGLRVLFTALAVFLLVVPFLQAAGGLLLTWIAYKLLRDETHAAPQIEAQETLIDSIRTIIMADAVMSLDNILAVGGAAHGSIALLLFGLALSMPILLFGSSVIARLMNRLPWLNLVGVGVLTVTAARMIVDDRIVAAHVPSSLHGPLLVGLAVGLSALVLIPAAVRWRRARQTRDAAGGEEQPVGAGHGHTARPGGN